MSRSQAAASLARMRSRRLREVPLERDDPPLRPRMSQTPFMSVDYKPLNDTDDRPCNAVALRWWSAGAAYERGGMPPTGGIVRISSRTPVAAGVGADCRVHRRLRRLPGRARNLRPDIRRASHWFAPTC